MFDRDSPRLRRSLGPWLLLLLASLLTWGSAQAASTWTYGKSLYYVHEQTSAALLNTTIYVAGGSGGEGQGTYGRVLEVGDANLNGWSHSDTYSYGAGPPFMPVAKYEHAMVTLDGRIYAIGGRDTYYDASVLVYSPAARLWSSVAGLQSARAGLAAVVTGGKIYALGGMNNSANALASVEAFDPFSNTWTDVAPLQTARFAPAATVGADGRIYVFGGAAADGSLLASAEVYDPATDTWSPTTPPQAARYGGAAVTAADGKIYLMGGITFNGTTNSVEAYRPETDTWSYVAPMNAPRYRFGAVVRANTIYVCGGAAQGTTEKYQANTPPTLSVDKTLTVNEDAANTPLGLSASDADGDALTILVNAVPLGTLGSVRLAGGGGVVSLGQTLTVSQLTGLEFDPATDANGPAGMFRFTASDGQGGSASQTVTLAITAVNDAPSVVADSFTVPEDGLLSVPAPGVLSNDADVEEDAMSAVAVGGTAHGALTLFGDGSLLYQPDRNYSGTDSFTYRAKDAAGAPSGLATVTLTITPTADPPAALSQAVTTPEDTAKALTLAGTDPDGDSLTYSVVTPPQHGTLSGSGAARTYTPTANFAGEDSLTFRVSDGTSESAVATVSLTVTPVNDLPQAAGQGVLVTEDTPKAITLAATDPDGDPLLYTVVAQPAHGALVGSGANRTYTPTANYAGADSFTFRANDGSGDGTLATVSITVSPVNDPPVAQPGSFLLGEDTPATVPLAASDPDGDSLAYAVVSLPMHGTLSGNGATRTYTPDPNYSGTDTLTFRVSDGAATSNLATVDLTITPANDAPLAVSEAVSILESTATSLTLTALDPDGDALTYTVVSAPAHGLLTGSGASRTYTPLKRYHGPDSLQFKVSDGRTESSVATLSITVLDVTDPPIAVDDEYSTSEDTPLQVTLPGVLENDWDGEGGALTAVRVTNPSHGTLALNANGSFTYTPAADYSGPDSFTYRVREGQTNGGTATVTLTVTPVNDAPVSSAQSVTLAEDASGTVTLSAVDPEGDSLSYAVVNQPSHGTLTGSGASRTYTPAADFNGTDSFTYRASDGQATGNLAIVTLTVTPANDAPVAAAGADQTLEATGATTPVSLNGEQSSDPDGDALTYSWSLGATTLGTGATLTTPLPVGQHTVKLTVADPSGASATDLVAITIRDTTAPTLTLPAGLSVPQTRPNGAIVLYTVGATDAVSAVNVVATPASGSAFPVGNTTVNVTATDAAGNQKTGSFVVTITAPVGTAGKLTAKGAILVQGLSAKLTLTALQKPGKPLKASLSFTDPVSRQTLKSTTITALVISGTKAQVFGQGTLTNVGTVKFVAEAEDLGTTPGADRFRLELSDGRVFGAAPLSSGSVTISR